MASLLDLPEGVTLPHAPEFFETLLQDGKGMRVERIVSWGHVTPEGEWYDQSVDEWVVVLEGEARLGFGDGTEHILGRGEHLFLPCMSGIAYCKQAAPVSGWPSMRRSWRGAEA